MESAALGKRKEWQKRSINEKTGSFSLSAEDVVRGRHLDKDCPTVYLEAFREVSFVLLG